MADIGATIRLVVNLALFLEKRHKRSKERREDPSYAQSIESSALGWIFGGRNNGDQGGEGNLEGSSSQELSEREIEELVLAQHEMDQEHKKKNSHGLSFRKSKKKNSISEAAISVENRKSASELAEERENREFFKFAQSLLRWAEKRLVQDGADEKLKKEVRAARKSLEVANDDKKEQSARFEAAKKVKQLLFRLEDMVVDEMEESAIGLGKSVDKSARVIHRRIEKAVLSRREKRRQERQLLREEKDREATETAQMMENDYNVNTNEPTQKQPHVEINNSKESELELPELNLAPMESRSGRFYSPKVNKQRRSKRQALKRVFFPRSRRNSESSRSTATTSSSDSPVYKRRSIDRSKIRGIHGESLQNRRLSALHRILRQQELSSTTIIPDSMKYNPPSGSPSENLQKLTEHETIVVEETKEMDDEEAETLAQQEAEKSKAIDGLLVSFGESQEKESAGLWKGYIDILRSASWFRTSDETSTFIENALESETKQSPVPDL